MAGNFYGSDERPMWDYDGILATIAYEDKDFNEILRGYSLLEYYVKGLTSDKLLEAVEHLASYDDESGATDGKFDFKGEFSVKRFVTKYIWSGTDYARDSKDFDKLFLRVKKPEGFASAWSLIYKYVIKMLVNLDISDWDYQRDKIVSIAEDFFKSEGQDSLNSPDFDFHDEIIRYKDNCMDDFLDLVSESTKIEYAKVLLHNDPFQEELEERIDEAYDKSEDHLTAELDDIFDLKMLALSFKADSFESKRWHY